MKHSRSTALAPLLGSVIVGSFGILFVLYVLYQARFILTGPVITLENTLPLVTNERVVTLTGSTRNITSITLNDRPITTTEDGYFEESIILENGYTITSVAARDRYGRETSVEKSFVYRPQSRLE